MWDSISSLFGSTGNSYTPANQAKMDATWDAYNQGKISPDEASTQTGMIEKGSILGMTPSGFAGIAGQIGSAISPKDSWQSKLGGVAAQFGSQKLAQLAQAEKEKRMTDLLKQVLGQATSKQVTQTAGPDGLSVGGVSTGIPKADGFDAKRNLNNMEYM